MIYERLSDSERVNLENKLYWMSDRELDDLEEKYGESFRRNHRSFDLSALSVAGKIVAFAVISIGFSSACLDILSSVDLYFGPTPLDKLQEFASGAYKLWVYTIKPGLVTFAVLSMKTIGLSLIGHAGYEGVKTAISRSPKIKINGQEIKSSKKQ